MESKHSLNRNRKSPSHRSTISSTPPAKRARYKESNASRLRQEIKGMTVTGAVKNPRSSISSRSNSASESGSPVSRMNTARNATPKCTSPKSATSRQPSTDRSKDRNQDRRRDHSVKGKQDAALEKEKLAQKCASPPYSTSINSCKEVQPPKLPPSQSPSGLMGIDRHLPTGDEGMDLTNHTKPRDRNARPGACKSPETKGYGKPLVTPINKRLTIRRDQPWQNNKPYAADKVTTPTLSSSKSPNRKNNKAENRETPYQNATLHRPKLISTKIPTKVTVSGNKLRESNTIPNVFPDTKIPMLRANFGAKSLRPSSSSMHGRRSNSKSPPRQTSKKSPDKSRENSNTATCKLKQDNRDPPEIKHWTADRNKTPPRSPNRVRSPMQDRIAASEAKRKSPISTKDDGKFNQSQNKDTSPPPLTRPFTPVHNNRSFKPQLEDIKSSYLLLNKTVSQDSAKTVTKADKDSYKISHVVNHFNEETRRHKLIECKKKFQSSRFFEDSRFEKIEGLNWITWK